MDADDRSLLEASLAAAVDAHGGSESTDAALAGLGWEDMLRAEPVTATALVFERLGASNAGASVLDDVVADRLGLALGSAIVHPAWGLPAPTGTLEGLVLDAEGTVGSRALAASALAHVLMPRGIAVVDSAALQITDLGEQVLLRRVALSHVEAQEWLPLDSDVLAAAASAARLALGHQLHGLAVSILGLARDHAIERIQFGRPIASFQAVRHKLAETLVSIESAAEALAVADELQSPLAIDLARVLAGQAARDAAKHGQQVLAGIGFTGEHDFHRYLFTSLEVDGLYGTTSALVTALGRQLLDTREVPRVVEL